MNKNPMKLITYKINVTPKKLEDVKAVFNIFDQAVLYLNSKAPKNVKKFHQLKKLYFRAVKDKFRFSDVLATRVIGKVSTSRMKGSDIRGDLLFIEKASLYLTESKVIIDSPLSLVCDYEGGSYCGLEIISGLLVLKTDRLLLSVRFEDPA